MNCDVTTFEQDVVFSGTKEECLNYIDNHGIMVEGNHITSHLAITMSRIEEDYLNESWRNFHNDLMEEEEEKENALNNKYN